jgi:chorismate mutase/prephenate dehydratase
VRRVRFGPLLVGYSPHLEQEGGRVAATSNDPVIKHYREQISDNDVKILEALNKRIKLVKSLKDYKEAQGLSFYDAAQEDWVVTYLCRANRGPLSNEGLREIYQLVLQVAKREAATLSDKEQSEGARS